MQRLFPQAKIVLYTLGLSFGPILGLERGITLLPFWPFSETQTLILALVSATLVAWYMLQAASRESICELKLPSPFLIAPRVRVLVSGPLRKPSVIIQRPQNVRWTTQAHYAPAALPLSVADRERLVQFIEEHIPPIENRQQQIIDFIVIRFSYDPFTRLYLSHLGQLP